MRDDVREVVLDACALLRLLQDEPGAEEVDRILRDAETERVRVLIHTIRKVLSPEFCVLSPLPSA